jgi:hypothetical protein
VPAVDTESVKVVGGAAVNVAVTLRAALIVTTQFPVPEHAPLQPAKLLPALGVAASVTTVPAVKLLEQVPGQLIPAGPDATVPLPVPAVLTESVKLGGGVTTGSNVAVTLRAALMVTVHAPVPEQAPLHPANVLPFVGVAVSVTTVPFG